MARIVRTIAIRAATMLVLPALLAASPASAALYKWVDANGRTVYSDQPPLGNVKAEVVGGAPPPANPNAVKEMHAKEAELKKRQVERAEDAKKGDLSRLDAQRLAQFCAQARGQIAGLARIDTVVYRLNDKGERVVMDEATRRAEIERLEQSLRERKCPPPA
jgi:hypothetical protein